MADCTPVHSTAQGGCCFGCTFTFPFHPRNGLLPGGHLPATRGRLPIGDLWSRVGPSSFPSHPANGNARRWCRGTAFPSSSMVGERRGPRPSGLTDRGPAGNAVPLPPASIAPCATAIQSNLSERSRRSSERSGGGGDPAVFAAQSPLPNPQSPAPTPLFQNFKVPRKNALMIRDFGVILKHANIVAPFAVHSLHPPGVELPISKAAPARRGEALLERQSSASPFRRTLAPWFISVFCTLYSVFCILCSVVFLQG